LIEEEEEEEDEDDEAEEEEEEEEEEDGHDSINCCYETYVSSQNFHVRSPNFRCKRPQAQIHRSLLLPRTAGKFVNGRSTCKL
jgi:hypothetical protein